MKKNGKLFITFLIMLMTFGIFSTMTVLADNNVRPKKVIIQKSSMTVYQGAKFEIRAKMTPKNANDDYLRWEIVSGKKYVKFDDNDRNDDEIELKAAKPGKAKIRCYIKGKSKTKYGDVITVTVKPRKANYSLSRVGMATRTVEIGDDFELKVKHGHSISEKQLKWKIESNKIVGFDDNDRKGNDVEFEAKRVGTTKITCISTNKNAKPQKITFTIKVIEDRDDHDDDND